ncbi:hypothetical protein BDP27DRAFT_363902 [Rhodocollybia butyracea]|uniref:Uncharacterized protein n=1 Tax=Rhodocollybia butyracea TaxID=206335 RepID=A0A9P5U190_9AGAR|nr:hypothetical protein BDP27DRAFT_363902 [Rhodocollybia butyracea]
MMRLSSSHPNLIFCLSYLSTQKCHTFCDFLGRRISFLLLLPFRTSCAYLYTVLLLTLLLLLCSSLSTLFPPSLRFHYRDFDWSFLVFPLSIVSLHSTFLLFPPFFCVLHSCTLGLLVYHGLTYYY